MDLSSKQMVASAVNERKRWVDEGTGPASRAGLRGVVPAVGPGPQLVAFEAGHQMKWGADTLKKLAEVQVHVVHPNEGKGLTESRGKTDRGAAKKLAEWARAGLLPRAVHVVEGVTREFREVVRARQQLQSKRVALLNTLRGYVRQDGHRLPATCFASLTWRAQRARLLLSAPLKLISETCRASSEALTAAERQLTDRLRAIRDPRCTLLESIPTIGTLASRTLVGALDEARRFDEQKAVGNAGALTPTIYQSGEVRQLGRLPREGRLEVRRGLRPCAHTLVRMKSQVAKPLQQFYGRIARRRGPKIALVALARKLLTTA